MGGPEADPTTGTAGMPCCSELFFLAGSRTTVARRNSG